MSSSDDPSRLKAQAGVLEEQAQWAEESVRRMRSEAHNLRVRAQFLERFPDEQQ